jgi:Protein of unknown function (DUF3631)
MPDHALDACALWVLHTHLIGFFDISPRLAITSPEKQCGKTTTIDVLTRLVWRPLPTANTTAAAIFRVVEMLQPTLFIDEADTFLPENDELRGILNSGHRRNGSVLRTIGDDHEPRAFPTFSACAIAMIGKLPGTLADRSVPIELQRRLAGEPIESFRSDRTGHLDQLARKAARWAADNGERLCGADPMMPPGIFNRVADNWRSLLAIADLAGGDWPARARRALEVIQLSVEDESIRVQLLTDIRTVFSERAVDRLLSGDLVAALVNMEGRSWAEWKGGKPLSTHGLARLLKPLKIRPGTKRLGDETAKGYYLSQFDEAFRRYLGQNGRPKPSHRHDVDEMGTTDPFNPAHPGSDVTDEKCKKPSNHNDCDGVTDASGERPALGPPGDSLDDFR